MDVYETSKILDNLYLVDVRVGFPSGTVSGSDDLVATSNKEIVRVGVQIFDPRLQRPFSAARQKIRRVCNALGSSFLGGYAVPEGHIEEFKREVLDVRASFLEAQNLFLERLEENNRIWADTHPDLRPVILASCPSRSTAEKSFKFAMRICKVVPPEPEAAADVQNNSLFDEVAGLGHQIAREIAQDVIDSWGGDLGTGKTTQKVIGLIRRCRKKAHGLAFVHPKVASLVSTIDEVLSDLPSRGPIEGVQYLKVVGLLRMLSDAQRILGNQRVIDDEGDPCPDKTEETEDTVATVDTVEDEHTEDGLDSEVINQPTRRPPSSMRVSWMF